MDAHSSPVSSSEYASSPRQQSSTDSQETAAWSAPPTSNTPYPAASEKNKRSPTNRWWQKVGRLSQLIRTIAPSKRSSRPPVRQASVTSPPYSSLSEASATPPPIERIPHSDSPLSVSGSFAGGATLRYGEAKQLNETMELTAAPIESPRESSTHLSANDPSAPVSSSTATKPMGESSVENPNNTPPKHPSVASFSSPFPPRSRARSEWNRSHVVLASHHGLHVDTLSSSSSSSSEHPPPLLTPRLTAGVKPVTREPLIQKIPRVHSYGEVYSGSSSSLSPKPLIKMAPRHSHSLGGLTVKSSAQASAVAPSVASAGSKPNQLTSLISIPSRQTSQSGQGTTKHQHSASVLTPLNNCFRRFGDALLSPNVPPSDLKPPLFPLISAVGDEAAPPNPPAEVSRDMPSSPLFRKSSLHDNWAKTYTTTLGDHSMRGEFGRDATHSTRYRSEPKIHSEPITESHIRLQPYTLDPVRRPFAHPKPLMIRAIPRDHQQRSDPNSLNEEGSPAGNTEPRPLDVGCMLRAYLEENSEGLLHLLEAVLAANEKQSITYEEMQEAQGNPYLIRLMVMQGALDVRDKRVREEIEKTVHRLIEESSGENELSPLLYDYLAVFFELPFIRLTPEEYTLLKRSGMEFVSLLCTHSHVLPRTEKLLSILVVYSRKLWWVNFGFIVLGFLMNSLVIVGVAWQLVSWFSNFTAESIGPAFYGCVTLGCGYILMLIVMMVVLRPFIEESESLLPKSQRVPLLYLNVMPFFPLYDIAIIVKYLRLRHLPPGELNLLAMQNLFAISRIIMGYYSAFYAISSVLYAKAMFLMGEWYEAMYMLNLRSSYFLRVTAALHFLVVMFRFMWGCLAYDSTGYFGTGRHSISRWRRGFLAHPGMSNVLLIAIGFVWEVYLFLIAMTVIHIAKDATDCIRWNAIVLGICVISEAIIAVTFIYLFITRGESLPLVYICGLSCIPIAISAIAVMIMVSINTKERNAFCYGFTEIHFISAEIFDFGLVVLIVYLCLFLIWLFSVIFFLAKSMFGRIGIEKLGEDMLTSIFRNTIRSDDDSASVKVPRHRSSKAGENGTVEEGESTNGDGSVRRSGSSSSRSSESAFFDSSASVASEKP